VGVAVVVAGVLDLFLRLVHDGRSVATCQNTLAIVHVADHVIAPSDRPRPPSTRSTAPVMYAAAGESRNVTTPASSSTVPNRASGTRSASSL